MWFRGLLLIRTTVQNQLSVAATQPICRGHARVKTPTMRPASFHSSNSENKVRLRSGTKSGATFALRKSPTPVAPISGTTSTRLADNRGVDCQVPSAHKGLCWRCCCCCKCFTSCVLKGHRRRESHSVFNRRKVPWASFARANSF